MRRWTKVLFSGLHVTVLIALLAVAIYGAFCTLNYFASAGVPPIGGQSMQVIDGILTPVGYHQYTSLATSKDLSDGGTFTIPANAQIAWIQAETKDVRWRDADYADGDTTNPTATVGMVLAAGNSIWYHGNLKAIEFIETSASAKLNVSFYAK